MVCHSILFHKKAATPRDQLTLSVASTSRLKFWPFRVFTVIFILASFKRCINGAALIIQRSSKWLPKFLTQTVLLFCSSGFLRAAKVCKVAAHQSRFRGLLKMQRKNPAQKQHRLYILRTFQVWFYPVLPGKKRGYEPNDHIQMLPNLQTVKYLSFELPISKSGRK